MKFRNSLGKISASLFVISMVTFAAASPAFATDQRTLPTGDTLYAFPCHHDLGEPTLELVNTADSTWTTIGVGHEISDTECAYQPAFNPVTGRSYFLGGNTVSNFWPLVEVLTGDGTMRIVHNIQSSTGNVNFDDGDNFPGNLLINNLGHAFFIGGKTIYPLDLSNGKLGTRINATPWATLHGMVFATACSPVEAKCYILTDQGDLYELNVSEGTVSASLGNVGFWSNYSLQVDSAGTLWASSYSGMLASFQAYDPHGTYIQGAGFPHYSGALLITSGHVASSFKAASPVLANTGSNTFAVLSLALALTAFGGLLLRLRPTTRRANN